MLENLRRWLKLANYQRHVRRKEAKFRRMAQACLADNRLFSNEGVPLKQPLKSLLVVDTLHCFGDSLYVNALLKEIEKLAIDVTVLTEKTLFDTYLERRCRLLNWQLASDLEQIQSMDFDLVLDLDYKDDGEWDFRQRLYGSRRWCVVTLSRVIAAAKVFTGRVDLDGVVHFGERMGKAAQFVKAAAAGRCAFGEDKVIQFDHQSLWLKPVADVKPLLLEAPSIYINAQGQKTERSLSDQQVQMLANWFNQQKKFVGLFYLGSSHYSVRETSQVKIVRTPTFAAAMQLAAGCVGIVTTDTSMVHVASALGRPLLAVYALGKIEYPSGRDQLDVWAPLGTQVTVYTEVKSTVGQVSVRKLMEVFKKFLNDVE